MSDAHTARKLRRHVEQMQTMTRFVLATLSLASGVYTYLGVRSLLDGSATLVFFAAIIYAAAVSVGIYGFWTYLIRFLPEIRDGASRMALSWGISPLVIGRDGGRFGNDHRDVVMAERGRARGIGGG